MTLLAIAACATLLGSVAGRVIDADTDAPIAGARITIAGAGATAASALVLTDDEGRFRRDGLVPGRYELSAAARGYVAASGRWAEWITVDTAATEREVMFRLHRSAVLAGFITDESGEPIANLAVEAIQAAAPPSRAIHWRALQTVITDDRGYYRFWGLRAGRYLVAARPSVADLAAGRVDVSPAASFYPGVHAPSLAEAVAVPAAAEVDGINFSIRSGRLSKLTIRVVEVNGHAPPEASVSVSEAGSGAPQSLSAFPAEPGSFVVPQMPPGDYVIQAVAGRAGSAVSSAAQSVTIPGDGEDVSVELATTPAARLSGQLVAAADASPWPRGAAVSVSSASAGDENARFIPAPGTADPFIGAVHGDGRFSTAVLPGRRTIRVTGLPPGWAILSITLDSRDVVDREITFLPGDTVSRARIIVTDRLGTITGTVADAGATAVIFNVDRLQWTPGTRAILQADTDQHGRFRIPGVRPGDYLAAAVPREWSDRPRDPAFLESLARAAETLTVRAGESTAIALTVRP